MSSATTCAPQTSVFGNSEINLANSKIQVLAKLAAKGILGNEQTSQRARATIKNAQTYEMSLGVFRVERLSFTFKPIFLRLSPSPNERVVLPQSSYGRWQTSFVS
jgi:hypothetical protein